MAASTSANGALARGTRGAYGTISAAEVAAPEAAAPDLASAAHTETQTPPESRVVEQSRGIDRKAPPSQASPAPATDAAGPNASAVSTATADSTSATDVPPDTARHGAPDAHAIQQLESFAVRAAHALRSSESARDAGLELERSRALLSVVGEAISQLSLAHTLETAIERVAHLLGVDRVAVYLTEGEELTVAASRGIEGPHGAVAHALLAAAVQSRQAGVIVEIDAADERLEQVRAHVEESGISSVLALGLVVRDDPIGVLAVYPRRPRPLSENERSLLTALAGQLAVAVQNARLHERVTVLYDDLKDALASEREKSKRLHAQHEISRTFAQSLSLETTLDVLASSIVDLLGVDAAVIRMPDERGVELVARSVHVDDERVDPAARALLSRPQPLPRRELLALLRRSEPLLLDPELAESFGGALTLLAPFLRKGSSAAVIPIATPTELLATLTIISLHPGRPVAGEIVETALSIAGQAALAIDNARLYGQQKAFADTMQRSLLPRTCPGTAGARARRRL